MLPMWLFALFKFVCKKPLKIWLKTPQNAKSYHIFIFPKQILKSRGFSAKPPFSSSSSTQPSRRLRRRSPPLAGDSATPLSLSPLSRPAPPPRRPAYRPAVAALSPPTRAGAGRQRAVPPGASRSAPRSRPAPLPPLSRPAAGGTARAAARVGTNLIQAPCDDPAYHCMV
jgi:hypothetical protein